MSRRLGILRLIRANPESPYYAGLTEVLLKAFGPPAVIGAELAGVSGIDDALIFGWLATGAGTFHDTVTSRPLVPFPIDQATPSSSGS